VTDGADAFLAPIARSGRGNLWCNRRANRAEIGHPIGPHLFQHCVATTITMLHPGSIGIKHDLLRYASLATMNRAHSIEASRHYAGVLYKKTKPPEPEESAIRLEAGSVYSLTGAGAINCSRNLSQASTRKPNLVSSTWSLSALLCFTDLSQTSLPSQRCATSRHLQARGIPQQSTRKQGDSDAS
jgi:hypothetical protein